MTTYRLANFCFSLTGAGPVHDYLLAEFGCLPVVQDEPDIRFSIVDNLPSIEGGEILSGGVKAQPDRFSAAFGGMQYRIKRKATGYDVLVMPNIRMKQSIGWRANRSRFTNWNYLTPAEETAKNFMYWLFNFLTAQFVVETGRGSYLHASSFCRGERGVAIVATGGVGKTTAMLKLVSEDGWQYLSDDLGLLDRDGWLWRTPLRMQVYAYNVAGQPLLASRLLAGRSLPDRVSWNRFLRRDGLDGVRRRIAPEDFFGIESVAVSARLDTLIYLERVSRPDATVVDLPADAFSRRSMAVLQGEFSRQAAVVAAAHAADCPGIIPGIDTFLEHGRSLLTAAVDGARIRLVQVPETFSADALSGFLRELLARDADA